MDKPIEIVFTRERISEALSLIKKGEYVMTDFYTAFEVIKRQILTESEFVDFANAAFIKIKNSKFHQLNFNEIRKFIESEFLDFQHWNKNKKHFDFDDLRRSFDNCENYAQKYDFSIDNSKSNIFIWRTSTENDFETAKEKILAILKAFSENEPNTVISGVTFTIRGNERFIDINIDKNLISDKAFVGFDFREKDT